MQKLTNSDILALIDDLNQYLNGNVTNDGLSESLTDLQNKLTEIINKEKRAIDLAFKIDNSRS